MTLSFRILITSGNILIVVNGAIIKDNVEKHFIDSSNDRPTSLKGNEWFDKLSLKIVILIKVNYNMGKLLMQTFGISPKHIYQM